MPVAPHDLLWLAPGTRPAGGEAWAPWADADWLARAPVVVRRDARRPGLVPVGVRGHARHQRHAAWVSAADIVAVVTPSDIARRRLWRDRAALATIPAIAALDDIAPRLDDAGLDWGIGGSAGFSLASGIDMLHPASDLDLLIQAPVPLAPHQERALATLLDAAVPIDIQIATPHGGFCYRERHRTGGRVLLKTGHGPTMCDDPWRQAA